MKVSSKLQDTIRVVEVDGQLDASNATEFRQEFQTETDSDDKIVLDCANLQYLDSSGLATLLNLHKNVSARDGSLVICGISESILRVIKFTKLDQVLTITDTLSEALESLQGS